MAKCMFCENEIPDGLKFCPECGAALPVEAPEIAASAQEAPQASSLEQMIGSATIQDTGGYQAASQPPEQIEVQPAYVPPSGQGAYGEPAGRPAYAPPADQQPYGQPGDQQAYGQPGGQQPYASAQPVYADVQKPVNDSGSIGWGILGFFFPIVGLILFLVWKNTKPKCAKVAGIGAIVGFVLNLVLTFSMGGLS